MQFMPPDYARRSRIAVKISDAATAAFSFMPTLPCHIRTGNYHGRP
jgi:hypothetical protein